MKKLFLLLFVVAFFANISFGQEFYRYQSLETRVANTILRSQEINKLRGIKHPDTIFPKQKPMFILEDGNIYDGHVVNPEETLGEILKEFYVWKDWEDTKADIDTALLRMRADSINQQKGGIKNDESTESPDKKTPWWVWVILGFIVLVVLNLLFSKTEKKDKPEAEERQLVDPVKEGPPYVEGGVAEEDAGEYFFELLQKENPGIVIRLIDVRPGFLNTLQGLIATVKYADGTKKELRFRNVAGYAGKVSRDGGKTFQEEYFFQGCGNPVYDKSSIQSSENLIFTKEPIHYDDEENVSETTNLTGDENQIAHETFGGTSNPLKLLGNQNPENSELSNIVAQHLSMAEKFLLERSAYSAETTVVKNSEGTEITTLLVKMRPQERKKSGSK